jgi:Flp pilus assembly protein TadG
MRKKRSNRNGQVFVESALVILVYLTVLIGTLDIGQYMYFHQTLTERARSAARYGAVNWADRNGVQNIAVYNDATGTTNGARAILPGLTTAMVTVCLPGDTSCADPGNTVDSVITVTISGYQMVTFNLLMPQSFTNRPITVSLPSERPLSN